MQSEEKFRANLHTANITVFFRSGYANREEWERALIGRILRHEPAVFSQETGQIVSPRYPLKMTNKVFNHCLWTIKVFGIWWYIS